MKNIFILPTNGESKLAYYQESTSYHKPVLQLINIGGSDYKYQHIYITNNEDIKVDNWYIEHTQIKPNRFEIFKAEIDDSIENSKKIILTTNPKLIADGVQSVDDDFLNWFVNNSSCEYVEVDLFPINEFGSEITTTGYGFNKFNYKITIPKENPKQETLEENGKIKELELLIFSQEELKNKNVLTKEGIGYLNGLKTALKILKNNINEN